jgi:hypothetical protein
MGTSAGGSPALLGKIPRAQMICVALLEVESLLTRSHSRFPPDPYFSEGVRIRVVVGTLAIGALRPLHSTLQQVSAAFGS